MRFSLLRKKYRFSFDFGLEMMLANQKYNEKVDIWSFGMLLYEITTKTIPYGHCENQVQIYDEVCINKKTPPIPKDREIQPTLLELMQQCWNWDPQQRPSFTQIVQTLRSVVFNQRSTPIKETTTLNNQKT
jgi:serine/threonine protein kinase